MGNVKSAMGTFGKLTKSQKTVDLPKSSSDPLCIDCAPSGGNNYAQLSYYCSNEHYYTYADTEEEGATRIDSDATRMLIPAGYYRFLPTVGNDGFVCLRHTSDSVVTDGVIYEFVEADS